MVQASLEDRVNSLNERYENNPDYTVVKGSAMLTDHATNSLASLTQWRLVSPLECKMHIITKAKLEHDKIKKRDQRNEGMIVDNWNAFSDIVAWQFSVP